MHDFVIDVDLLRTRGKDGRIADGRQDLQKGEPVYVLQLTASAFIILLPLAVR